MVALRWYMEIGANEENGDDNFKQMMDVWHNKV